MNTRSKRVRRHTRSSFDEAESIPSTAEDPFLHRSRTDSDESSSCEDSQLERLERPRRSCRAEQRQMVQDSITEESYTLSEDEELKQYQRRSQKSITSELSLPKRALTAYAIFVKQRRKELQGPPHNLPSTEVMAVLGKEWNEMTRGQKQKYEEISQRGKLLWL